jgi:hypothetical protein
MFDAITRDAEHRRFHHASRLHVYARNKPTEGAVSCNDRLAFIAKVRD